MRGTLGRFARDERGAEVVEWAVVTIALLVATVPAILALEGELLEMFTNLFRVLEAPPPDTY